MIKMISKIIALVFIALFVLCIRWTKKANNESSCTGTMGDVFFKLFITIIVGIIALITTIIGIVSFF